MNVAPYGQTSHEEYANERLSISLEEAFSRGYIRVQAFEGHYLFIDHKQATILPAQILAIEELFTVEYANYVVERQEGSRGYKPFEKEAAIRFAVHGD